MLSCSYKIPHLISWINRTFDFFKCDLSGLLFAAGKKILTIIYGTLSFNFQFIYELKSLLLAVY